MSRSVRTIVFICLALLVFAGMPLAILAFQSYRSGMTWSQIIFRSTSRLGGESSGLDGMPRAMLPEGEPVDFLTPEAIGNEFQTPPQISHLEAVDLDQDGLLDVAVCDCESNKVSWIRQHPVGTFQEYVCADDLVAPAHVHATDFDQDGDLDLAVAVLGLLFPCNDPVGSVVILENNGDMTFRKHVVVERIARVSDVRTGDLDGDGDLDLAAAQFGYDDGETRWIENLGGWEFANHILQEFSGPIHCEITDADGDGDQDIITLVSQEWEQIYLFEGNGKGNFQPHQIFGSDNEDFGSSGISLCDLDQDGDEDILYTNGDAFDYLPPVPRSWHGVQWLENVGNLEFRVTRIADFHGAVNARELDFDHDGDLDLVVVSAYNFWDDPASQSMILLENDGKMRFARRNVTNIPTHLQSLDQGDFDNDGEVDLVTGGLHVYEPYDRMDRVVLWRNRWVAATPGL